MMKRGGFIAGLLLLSMLFGCTEEPRQMLRVGSNVWPGYEPLYLARSLGHYADSGVRLVELSSASDVMQGLSNGTLDAGALTLDESLSLLEGGTDVQVALVFDYSFGGDMLLAKPDIRELSDLRGRRIAAETTAVGAIMLNSALSKVQLTPADVEVVPCPVNRHVKCYADVAAVATFDPAATALLKKGAHRLFDSREIPGQIVDVLVVRRDVLANQADNLRTLIAGYFAARDYMSGNADDAYRRMAPRMAMSAQELQDSFFGIQLPDLQQNRELLSGEVPALQVTAGELAGFLVSSGLLNDVVGVDGLTNAEFLPAR